MTLLRHVGKKVQRLEAAVKLYQALGFKAVGKPETFKVQKMTDQQGQMFELIEGDAYDAHVAVNWGEDEHGELIEFVEVKG